MLAHTDILSSLLTHAHLNPGKRSLQHFSFIFSYLNLLLFSFLCRHHLVDASLPQKKCSLFHTEF